MADEVVGKPKKPFYKKVWFWILAILVLSVIASSGGGGTKSTDTAKTPASSESTSTTSAEKPAAAPAEKIAKIGDALKVGDLVFTVVDAKATKQLKSPLGNKTGNWMVVTVTVKNESKEAVTIDSSYFKLLEGDGTAYETDSDNIMYLDAEQSFFLEKINPKLEKQGKVLFAIPEGVKDLKLQVQTGLFGTETGEISLSK
ncbi:MAG: DUF4352 domain-containing protein [Actinomycetota bacterium]|nr:MAG: hypothetical protein FD171_1982 [Actinomycetota bacterium]MDO8950024.1 DUF4352 domain-containing protein [Actinomycetota bacterium]MDP3630183.1 DUF4352 domain-containing protein [Actinomycetota bacterium]